MKKNLLITSAILMMAFHLRAQVEPAAGQWKTWFITSGKDYRLTKPFFSKSETNDVIERQRSMDAETIQQMMYWNAGSPVYHWQEFMAKLWMNDTSRNGALANLLLNVAIYDATVAVWDTKYAVKRPRPFEADKRIRLYLPKPGSPSFPCEYSVAAGVAVAVINRFYPHLSDSVNRMAQRAMDSRIAAGVSFPSDTKEGFELGKKIAEKEIEHTKDFVYKAPWNGKMPAGPAVWRGKPSLPLAGRNKTVVLDSANQFRPAPPPDFSKDMEELRKFKPTFWSTANAFRYASQSEDILSLKIFEYNLHLNAPRAARIYAIAAIGIYDGFVSCWDAKYAYWGIRPDQYDTSFKPVLIHTPPFPGYPSGHAMLGSVMAELYTYFFPADKAFFGKRAKDGAESRFQGGIHFRTDNEVGLEMGKKVAAAIIQKIQNDGADAISKVTDEKVAIKK